MGLKLSLRFLELCLKTGVITFTNLKLVGNCDAEIPSLN